jgi:hypothetical protein
MGTKVAHERMSLSHVEIVTFDGMKRFDEEYLKTDAGMAMIFPKLGILDAFERSIKT